jgi:hypothetical protein
MRKFPIQGSDRSHLKATDDKPCPSSHTTLQKSTCSFLYAKGLPPENLLITLLVFHRMPMLAVTEISCSYTRPKIRLLETYFAAFGSSGS